MQVAQRGQDFQDVGDRLGDRQLLGFAVSAAAFERLPADVLHDDVADRIAVLVVVLDEVEDLHDRGVHDLGQELPFRHRDGLRLGITGMHQAFEHHRAVVDVVVHGQVDPAQPAVRDATLDLVLAGHDIAGIQLWHKGIRATAVRAPAFRGTLFLRTGPAHRATAVPAEPLGFRDHRILHQGGERIDVGDPGNLHQPAAELPDRRQRARRARDPVLRLRVYRPQREGELVVVIVVVEIGPEQGLGGLRPARPGRRTRLGVLRRRGRLATGEPSSSRTASPSSSSCTGLPISPRISVAAAAAPAPEPSTTCGTTYSRCRRPGCVRVSR